MDPRHAILFDADCGFCRAALRRVLARDADGLLRPVEIQSDEGQSLLAELDEGDRLASWHLVDPEGAILSGGAAAAPLARLVGARTTGAALERFPRVTDRAYRWVAAHRTRLSALLGTRCAQPRRA